MTAYHYHIVGTLIPSVMPEFGHLDLTPGEPIHVEITVVNTDPRFAAHMAAWEATLGYAIWRWQSPPTITQLED
jgi:hypothetical protein